MILCRRPLTLYDTDLLGMAGVAALAAAAWWFVAAPWQQMWAEYLQLSDAHLHATSQLQGDLLELERFEQELDNLDQTVAKQGEEVPAEQSFPRLLREMTDLAQQSRLELANVTPQSATKQGAYLVSDVRVGARGESRDFIRFLDQLAQANPHQCLLACRIDRTATAPQPICELEWVVRLFMLPGSAAHPQGDRQ